MDKRYTLAHLAFLLSIRRFLLQDSLATGIPGQDGTDRQAGPVHGKEAAPGGTGDGIFIRKCIYLLHIARQCTLRTVENPG